MLHAAEREHDDLSGDTAGGPGSRCVGFEDVPLPPSYRSTFSKRERSDLLGTTGSLIIIHDNEVITSPTIDVQRGRKENLDSETWALY